MPAIYASRVTQPKSQVGRDKPDPIEASQGLLETHEIDSLKREIQADRTNYKTNPKPIGLEHIDAENRMPILASRLEICKQESIFGVFRMLLALG